MGRHVRFLHVVVCVTGAWGCGFPRPTPVDDGGAGQICAANQALRCDASSLLRCNGEGTAEVSESCPLGCSTTELRCNDVDPSNGLAPYLDLTTGEPELDLGMVATINTDDGTIIVDNKPIVVKSTVVSQTSAPSVRVFIVHSLTAAKVTITGSNALAVVSNGDLSISGVFAASAHGSVRGAGAFNDGTCRGGASAILVGDPTGEAVSGAGGGGFGFAGGKGGSATITNGTATGGAGGTSTGNPTLVPLRGGCDSGAYVGTTTSGAGGGAIQLVSRTRIAITGVVAANGSSFVGGGSGGGILLEAPVVDVSGNAVANGGAGSGGCLLPQPGEDGRLDAVPAAGGIACNVDGSNGGDGGAGNLGARNGDNINEASTGGSIAFAGHGGGGVGRIRVNTAPGGLHVTGLFSPNPSTGTIGIR